MPLHGDCLGLNPDTRNAYLSYWPCRLSTPKAGLSSMRPLILEKITEVSQESSNAKLSVFIAQL